MSKGVSDDKSKHNETQMMGINNYAPKVGVPTGETISGDHPKPR